MGNLLVQAMGRGRIGTLADLRAVVARSAPPTVLRAPRQGRLGRRQRAFRGPIGA